MKSQDLNTSHFDMVTGQFKSVLLEIGVAEVRGQNQEGKKGCAIRPHMPCQEARSMGSLAYKGVQ